MPPKSFLMIFLIYMLNYNLSAKTSLNKPLKSFLTNNSTLEWLFIKSDSKINPDLFWDLTRSSVSIDQSSEFRLKRINTDHIGWQHFRYNHFAHGYLVEGSQYILHTRNGFVNKANGNLSIGNFQEPLVVLSPKEAAVLAHQASLGSIFEWNYANPLDSLPPLELVYAKSSPSQNQQSQNFKLYYKVEVNSLIPFGGWYVYIDAQTGFFAKAIPFLLNCVGGSATPLYNGNQNLDTEDRGWPNNDFFLKDDCRGSYIQTLSRSAQFNKNVRDDDNSWGTDHQAETSIHWAAERTYDYFQSEHSRNSTDNSGKRIKLIYRTDNNFSPNNASWSTNNDKAYFGEGDGISPFVSLDIVAHEITHGIVHYTSELEYAGESGALNESFADIFGTCVEHYAVNLFGPATTEDWTMGEDVAGGALRSLEDPGLFFHPDFFLGANWVQITSNCNGSNDNCGVHTNSGVQNRWFFLLSQGGIVTNAQISNGSIRICGLGIEDAARIAYRNLRFYLTQNSGFQDARDGSIQASEDIFGAGSFESRQVSNAWHAVGVGRNVDVCQPVAATTPQSTNPFSFTIYPNPVRSSSKVHLSVKKVLDLNLQVFSMTGVEKTQFFRSWGRIPQGKHEFNFNLISLPSGIYFVKVSSGKNMVLKKVIVQ